MRQLLSLIVLCSVEGGVGVELKQLKRIELRFGGRAEYLVARLLLDLVIIVDTLPEWSVHAVVMHLHLYVASNLLYFLLLPYRSLICGCAFLVSFGVVYGHNLHFRTGGRLLVAVLAVRGGMSAVFQL